MPKVEVTLEERQAERDMAAEVVDQAAVNYVEAHVLGADAKAGAVLDDALMHLRRAERRLERTRKRLAKKVQA